MPQERAIGTRAGRGDRLFSGYTSQSLKRIVHTGRVAACPSFRSNSRQALRTHGAGNVRGFREA
jgi:hypothetical protein